MMPPKLDLRSLVEGEEMTQGDFLHNLPTYLFSTRLLPGWSLELERAFRDFILEAVRAELARPLYSVGDKVRITDLEAYAQFCQEKRMPDLTKFEGYFDKFTFRVDRIDDDYTAINNGHMRLIVPHHLVERLP